MANDSAPESTAEFTAPRLLPQLDDLNRSFWTGGGNDELLILRNTRTGRWVYPPEAARPDEIDDLEAQPVSGRGTVYTFTINAHQYHPDVAPPYVVAIVQLDEQDDLRIPTNVIGCAPEDVKVGMAVQVAFEQQGEIYVPVFEPVA